MPQRASVFCNFYIQVDRETLVSEWALDVGSVVFKVMSTKSHFRTCHKWWETRYMYLKTPFPNMYFIFNVLNKKKKLYHLPLQSLFAYLILSEFSMLILTFLWTDFHFMMITLIFFYINRITFYFITKYVIYFLLIFNF
jgi:hypothetical protein